MLNTERRQPLEVMECLLHAIEYLRKPYSKLSSYSLPLLGLASHHCAALSQALDELIKEKSRPILVKDTPPGPARLSE